MFFFKKLMKDKYHLIYYQKRFFKKQKSDLVFQGLNFFKKKLITFWVFFYRKIKSKFVWVGNF